VGPGGLRGDSADEILETFEGEGRVTPRQVRAPLARSRFVEGCEGGQRAEESVCGGGGEGEKLWWRRMRREAVEGQGQMIMEFVFRV